MTSRSRANRSKALRNRGVVLLLILGLMAMFAMLILTFMVVTANMADTARSSAEAEVKRGVKPQEDADYAIKTLLAGSTNRRSPIAPFGMLENLYGDQTFRDGTNEVDYTCEVRLFYEDLSIDNGRIESGWLGLAPLEDSDFVRRLFEETGPVVTFTSTGNSLPDEWKDIVANTSSLVAEKVMVNPDVPQVVTPAAVDLRFTGSGSGVQDNPDAFTKNWYFKVTLTDELIKYFNENGLSATNGECMAVDVDVRFNRPAFSGTGAGYFSPEKLVDGQKLKDNGSGGCVSLFGVPWSKWGNAAAPDTARFTDATDTTGAGNRNTWSAQTFWAHLMDGNYYPDTYMNYDSTESEMYPSDTNLFVRTGMEPVRMNPSYTAPDIRSLFLAWYKKTPVASNDIVPSFHRQEIFDWFLNQQYSYDDGGTPATMITKSIFDSSDPNVKIDTLSVLRKLTPRPLQLDHWRFTGSNRDWDLSTLSPTWYGTLSDTALTPANQKREIDQDTQLLAQNMGSSVGASVWDVDNDNDGIKDGIWIPSGLPVRMSADGTPYFTMYSFTIVDMDGRVNVNTAGNWDQIPNKAYRAFTTGALAMPYESVLDVAQTRASYSPTYFQDMALHPLAHTETMVGYGSAYTKYGSFGWLNDLGVMTNLDGTSGSINTERGTGYGPSAINLRVALKPLELALVTAKPAIVNWVTTDKDNYGILASNLMWRRYLSHADTSASSLPFYCQKTNVSWINVNTVRNAFTQPGIDYASTSDTAIPGERDLAHWQFSFMDPIKTFTGISGYNTTDKAASKGWVPGFVFPWRGKTRIYNNDYDVVADQFPTFDFTDTAFRSYDALGHQVYTYAPRLGENPYRFHAERQSYDDSPYSFADLERILRPYDTDSGYLSKTLFSDLTNNIYMDTSVDPTGIKNAMKGVCQSITTLSSEIPAVGSVYVPGEGKANADRTDFNQGGGAYGVASLIRMCVTAEYLARIEKALTDNSIVIDPAKKETIMADLSQNLSGEYIDSIVSYLVSLLPEETLLGKKIDLNKLSQKTYWLDVMYNGNDEDNDFVLGTSAQKDEIHNYGLVKRMEYARGLYILMMALTYEDRKAGTCYATNASGKTYSNYFEKFFDAQSWFSDITNAADKKRLTDEYQEEWVANRIAQWCVNAVDFADPDATMTPFYYDPNPFDGWWGTQYIISDTVANAIASYIKTSSGNDSNQPYSFARLLTTLSGYSPSLDPYVTPNPLFAINWRQDAIVTTDPTEVVMIKKAVSPKERLNSFFYSAFRGPDTSQQGFVDPAANPVALLNKTNAAWIADSLKTAQAADKSTPNLGFRVVWGMERPDLVLTETMSFHDLGLADSQVADGGDVTGSETAVSGDPDRTVASNADYTYDQVRRPKGSTYLELYCAANPNIPQSPELYEFRQVNLGTSANPVYTYQWQLDLSRRTPAVTVGTETAQYPVWRVAITDSRDPRAVVVDGDSNSNEQWDTGEDDTSWYHKKANCVINKFLDDPVLFSFQPKQFRNLPMKNNTVIKQKNDGLNTFNMTRIAANETKLIADWKEFNLRASSLLGPTRVLKSVNEMELDRIVWFDYEPRTTTPVGQTTAVGSIGKYTDAVRTFVKKEQGKVYLGPNQYLVVGPEEVRSLGSWRKGATATNASGTKNKYDQYGNRLASTAAASWYEADEFGNYGIPSLNRINLSRLGGNYKYMVAVANMSRDQPDSSTNKNGINGLNISEPLWTSPDVDPYAERRDGSTMTSFPTGLGANSFKLFDTPFELPNEWATTDGSNKLTLSEFKYRGVPIAEEELFGVGTIPAYKSAFVQRVADPNRGYHPVLNPYISVDWNVMDLTVFNGEVQDAGNESADFLFADVSEFTSPVNQITLAANTGLNITADQAIAIDNAFSSRPWGNFGSAGGTAQNATAPTSLASYRPNPWARAFSFNGVANGGGVAPETAVNKDLLNEIKNSNGTYSTTGTDPINFAFVQRPKNSLGVFNDCGRPGLVNLSSTDGKFHFIDGDYGDFIITYTNGSNQRPWYKNLNLDYLGSIKNPVERPYLCGSPGTTSTDAAVSAMNNRTNTPIPMEHLVWNDAPFNNQEELLFVPASAPGRFGVEFVRNPEGGTGTAVNLAPEYFGSGRSLGTASKSAFTSSVLQTPFGFDYKDTTPKPENKMGPYLNFLNGSTKPGRSLNLGRLLDYVYVPSPALGTKTHRGFEWTDNGYLAGPILDSTMREPGKVNVNTVSQDTVWDALRHGMSNTSANYTTFSGERNKLAIQDQTSGRLNANVKSVLDYSNSANTSLPPLPSFFTLQRASVLDVITDNHGDEGNPNTATTSEPELLFNSGGTRQNMFTATQEMQLLSGLTTTRSNVFAVWVTVGYFEAERVKPGVNVPKFDPNGDDLNITDAASPYYHYYKAIYPDGYTYGRELGSVDGETNRSRFFYLIDRSVPVDFRRGQSLNWEKTILIQRQLD